MSSSESLFDAVSRKLDRLCWNDGPSDPDYASDLFALLGELVQAVGSLEREVMALRGRLGLDGV